MKRGLWLVVLAVLMGCSSARSPSAAMHSPAASSSPVAEPSPSPSSSASSLLIAKTIPDEVACNVWRQGDEGHISATDVMRDIATGNPIDPNLTQALSNWYVATQNGGAPRLPRPSC